MSDQDEQDPTPVEEPKANEPEEPAAGSGKRTEDAAMASLRRENAKLKKAQEQAERDKQAEQGRWKELAEAAERERDELKAASEVAARERTATKAAAAQRFIDPADAMRFLSAEDLADDASAERALKRLAKEKPYLIEPARERTGAAVGTPAPGDGAADSTLAQGQRILAAFQRGKAQ